MIGDTTWLITGKRGNGKTLMAVGLMKKEIAEGRPTFACNFNGLKIPGIQVLDDPREWQTLPAGSILFVDEAQKFWRARRSGDPPPELQAMETQRHLGITIVLLTQQPTYLDKHIRGLVDEHHHLVLEVGGKASRHYTWRRCIDDCEEANARDTAEFTMFRFPKEDFGGYESAEIHTIKPKIPQKLKLLAGAAVVIVGIFAWVFSSYGGDAEATALSAGVPAAGGTPSMGEGGQSVRASGPVYGDAESYLAAFKPRIPEIPWSASAWDGREVVSDPHVYCMASGFDGRDGCNCYTEQGTRYAMDLDKCLVTARYGEPYNPFKSPDDRRGGGRSKRTASEEPAPVAGSVSDLVDAAL